MDIFVAHICVLQRPGNIETVVVRGWRDSGGIVRVSNEEDSGHDPAPVEAWGNIEPNGHCICVLAEAIAGGCIGEEVVSRAPAQAPDGVHRSCRRLLVTLC